MRPARLHILLPSIIMCLFMNRATAQMDFYNKAFTHQKDSLEIALSKHPAPDTIRVNTLIHLMDCAIFLSQRKQVLPYYNEALQLSRRLKDKNAEADCLHWMGSFYKSAQKNDSAILYLDAAIVLAGNATDEWMRNIRGSAQFEKGLLYEFQENYYKALSSYFAALTTYNGADARKQKMLCLRIAEIYVNLRNDEKALDYYQAALKYYKASANPTNEAEGIYTFIAGIYYNRGDYAKALACLNNMRPYMPDTTETMVTGGYYHLAGQIALKEKKTDTAIALLKNALKYFEYTAQMHKEEIAEVNANLATLHMEKNEMDEAKKYADQSMASAKSALRKDVLVYSLQVSAAYDSKSGNPEAAYQASQQAALLNDSIVKATNVKQAGMLAAFYENDKKEKEILQLESEKKIQLATVKQKTLLNTIFIITIGALLVISAVLFLNFKNKQKIERQKIAELEKEKQLTGVEAMLKGEESERSRLAKDLHDGLGGMLSGVRMSFSTMKENMVMTADGTTLFEKSLQQLDGTIAELRKVAHNMMPEALMKYGLRSAVADFCESMQLSGNTKIIYEQFGSDRELSNTAAVNIYRVIQELVNNAIIHGKPAQVLVQLTIGDDSVLITVEDDGKGFDQHAAGKQHGIGLANIRHRVNYFNGEMEIDAEPGGGTTVNIELNA